MSNFFDIATPEEAASIFGNGETLLDETVARWRAVFEQEPNTRFEYFAYLFANRGDFLHAHEYLMQMEDGLQRMDAGRMMAHDPAYVQWVDTHAA